MAAGGQTFSQMIGSGVLDSEESKNIAVVHKTNQGYSGKDLWKLKQERPDLFSGAAHTPEADGERAPPPGYVDAVDMPGWLVHREKGVFLNKESWKQFVRHPETNELYELHKGDNISEMLRVRGDAATCPGKNGSASKHVMISDLHKAAQAMKLDFLHHDSPAAMFAVYDAQPNGSPMAEAAAKGLHVRLLPRLAAYRGLWQNEKLEEVLGETLASLGQEINPEGGVAVAVALQLGGRLTLAATGGAAAMLFGPAGGCDDNIDLDVVGDNGGQPNSQCVVLEDSHMGVLLTTNCVRTAPGLSSARLRAMARMHVSGERPRAACLTVLAEARRAEVEAPMVAAAVRLMWSPLARDDAPPAKKAKTNPAPTKVRCRHILLRHKGCQAAQGERNRPKPTRSVAEAEEQLLAILPELTMCGASAFTSQVRKISECDTALRGGDLAGDLGWLDKDPAKNKKIPAAVIRTAFLLQVNQMSDIVPSERGIHLLLRTA